MSIDALLVNPVFLSQNEAERELMSPYIPLGLLYLASFLRDRGFQVEIFDGTFQEGDQDFIAALEKYSPTTVGITALKPNARKVLELANIAKQRGSFVIVGGPDPTYSPEYYLQDPSVDLVVHHEGELTMAEVLQARQDSDRPAYFLGDMPGIAYRDQSGELVVNPRRDYLLNLDHLPAPARDMVDTDRYLQVWREHNGYASLSISVSRGCPYGCKWCADAVHGQEFRIRSVESVVAEVKSLRDTYHIDRLRLVDDVDGIDAQWIADWAAVAEQEDAVLPFEALYEVERQDIPMLDIRDSL
jgi:anaerobic magnesium-protoporphyrin IX monomethyl ester cyclase